MTPTIEQESSRAIGIFALLIGHFERGAVAWHDPIGYA